jgi:predicted hydrocarbon binding protein
MTQTARKYAFTWDLLGDIALGRLMQYCFRDVLEQRYGAEEADRLFYEAGALAGREFYANVFGPMTDFQDFVKQMQVVLREMGIGILRVEKADLEAQSFVLTVSEDLDCSGLPERDTEVCIYDEGFIAALLESFTGRRFKVKEVDCWCTGDRTCRFTAEVIEG